MIDTPIRTTDGDGFEAVYDSVETYYASKLARHGAEPRGVDWSCTATQWLRFVQLLKLCDFGVPFSLIDLGCGYGALAAYLGEHCAGTAVDYLGVDISRAMVAHARRLHRGRRQVRFAVGRRSAQVADYALASGILNVKLDHATAVWEDFVRVMLADLDAMGRRGFAVNLLTRPPADKPPIDSLYYGEPERWAHYCRSEFGRHVEIIDGYGLREATLLARAPGEPSQVLPGALHPARCRVR